MREIEIMLRIYGHPRLPCACSHGLIEHQLAPGPPQPLGISIMECRAEGCGCEKYRRG